MTSLYKSRSILAFLCFGALYVALAFNLLCIQIIRRNYYISLGEKQYTVHVTTWSPRAPIFDRTGKQLLAMNKDSLAAFILPRQLEDRAALKKFLKKHFPKAAQRLDQSKKSYFMYVKRRLSPSERELIEKSGIKDIKFLNEPSRFYPIPATGPLIGITDIDNKGLFGIELQYQSSLAGKPSTFQLEKDARSGNFYFNKETKIKGTEPEPLTVTIDATLQFLIYEAVKDTIERFGALEGGVIVLNPTTGEIIAMASAPSFDPNNTHEIPMDLTKNKMVTEAYELGSVIKVCAAMAAIEEGVVTPDELIDCKNAKTAYVDGRKINTVKEHGIIPFWQVIAQSNNIGIAQVAQRVDITLYDYYRKLGFGQKTGINVPGEQKGFINHPDNWSKQSIISLSYGYELSATLLQLARTFCLIANGGHLITPQLIKNNEYIHLGPQLFKTSTITIIQNMLEKTTLEGTAKKAAIKGYRVMSKTGTANLIDSNGLYNHNRNIFTCAGIIQKGNYQRVIVAFVKEAAQKNVYASTVAAPLSEKLPRRF